ncbi:hypothetical protein AVEN_159021-1 [Araneus ventricosus]|uniref:Uncharacterized protein n=1 Tax=Araneus ventricosus TaxID=182803 RepID=A0A4Y2B9A3_ARAVE|nr:hypothetical protein AVEN_159021-1 [Araneus ventricosus]
MPRPSHPSINEEQALRSLIKTDQNQMIHELARDTGPSQTSVLHILKEYLDEWQNDEQWEMTNDKIVQLVNNDREDLEEQPREVNDVEMVYKDEISAIEVTMQNTK